MEQILSPENVRELLNWYQQNKRDLPWRQTKDPYRIWISEIMLQQTRVEAVKPYYARFLTELPTVQALAEVGPERLMKLWEGLGYYSRARNLQKAAQTVVEQYGGSIPADEAALRKLCGIGDYTAGAIASIAFDIPAPAVDGNVLRVLSRFCGSFEDIAAYPTKQRFGERLRSVIPKEAGDFNQALIELGATVCVPNGEAQCDRCPLQKDCAAFQNRLTDVLPVRTGKRPRRIEPITVLLIRDGNRTVLRRRPPKGLLAGLYELPNLSGHLGEHELPEKLRAWGLEPLRIERIEDAKHIFTHIEWHMIAYTVQISPEFDGYAASSEWILVENSSLHSSYAIPSAFFAYIKYL